MNILLFLIPTGLLVTLIALGAFLWSLNSRQFDDLEGASWRILRDDDIGGTK
jgi:cbb3-type cytochrome oxidase maturation protein